MLVRGAEALTDAELVAILLHVGVRGTNAIDMARQLLESFGSLRGLAEAPTLAFLDVKGLKKAKAAQLAAAMEISRRIALTPGEGRKRITSTSQAGAYLCGRLRALPEEHFRVLCLNRRMALLADFLVARGDVGAVQVSLRQIVSRALQVNASALIAAHNHPSGDTEPSESDRLLAPENAFIKITTFKSEARVHGPLEKQGNLESLSMLMLDYDYNAERGIFEFDQVFYADTLKENGWTAFFPGDKLGKSLMAIFVDVYGNEARELIGAEQFREKSAARKRTRKRR